MKTSSSSAAAYIPPPGIIEVVSNNWKDDYLTKLAEYIVVFLEDLLRCVPVLNS